LVFPTLSEVIFPVVILVVGVLVVYLLSKALKLCPKPITISNPRKEATIALLAFLIVLAATFALIFFYHAVFNPAFQLDKRPPFTVDTINVLWAASFYVTWIIPLGIAMKITNQNRESIGITRENLGRSLALGFVLSAIFITVSGLLAPSLGGGFKEFSASLAYGLIVYAILGYGEEVVFRGYIQTRLTAYSGTIKGWILASLLFALIHFPKYYFIFPGAVLDASVHTLLRFPTGLLLGYIMLRSQNLNAPSIFLLFIHWSPLLWQIPFT